LFYLTAGDAASKPVIASGGITTSAEGKSQLALRIDNPGNAHARLDGEIKVTGAGAGPLTMPIGNLVVLHEGTRDYAVDFDQPLPAGAKIDVKLENTFAPQIEGATESLPVYTLAVP
jgi:P pilus assembly chaperone PapD